MPNEKDIEPESFNPVDFDPEKISRDTARVPYEPSVKIYARDPELKKDPFKAMGEVRLAGKNESEITDPVEGLLIGAAMLETAEKELNPAPKQKETFDGVLENIHGAIAWAKGATEEAKDYITANKVVRKTLIGAQVVGLTLTSAGCVNAINTPETTPTSSPIVETLPPPTETLPTPTETSESGGAVTAENTKNIEPVSLLTADSFGKLSGFPEGTSAEIQSEASLQYLAIQKKFPTSSVYFAQDPKSGQWLLFSEMAGNIFYNTASDAGGNEIYSNYPLAFNTDGTGVIGNSSLLAMPGEIGVIWKNGLPQLVAGKVKLDSGDTYYKKYLDYSVQVNNGSPWKEIPGVAQMVEAEAPKYEPGTVTLNPEYNFGGQIELIAENNQAFYDNFLDSLIRINREYFKTLTTKKGVVVTEVATLRTYLGENDWTIPPGVQLPIKSPRYGSIYVDLSQPLDKSLNIRNIDIAILNTEGRQKALEQGYFNPNDLFLVALGPNNIFPVDMGFGLIENSGNYSLSIVVAKPPQSSQSIFSISENSPNNFMLTQVNNYIRFLLYAMRTMQINPKSDLELEDSATHNPGKDYWVVGINKESGVGTISDTLEFFTRFSQSEPLDSAPKIIKLK